MRSKKSLSRLFECRERNLRNRPLGGVFAGASGDKLQSSKPCRSASPAQLSLPADPSEQTMSQDSERFVDIAASASLGSFPWPKLSRIPELLKRPNFVPHGPTIVAFRIRYVGVSWPHRDNKRLSNPGASDPDAGIFPQAKACEIREDFKVLCQPLLLPRHCRRVVIRSVLGKLNLVVGQTLAGRLRL